MLSKHPQKRGFSPELDLWTTLSKKKKFLPRKSPFPSLGLAGATPQFGWAASRPPASYPSFPGDTGRAGQTQTCITAPLASHGTLSLLHPGQATAAQPGCAGLTPQAEVSPRRGLMASSLGMSWDVHPGHTWISVGVMELGFGWPLPFRQLL